MQEIKTQGMCYIDDQGRERIFHGLNLKCSDIKEGDPSYGLLAELDETFFKRAVSLGFNVLRIGIHWESFETEKGKINEGLLTRLDEIFAMASQYGVYIFLDMHQDLYGSFDKNRNGGGAPPWATITDGIKRAPKAHFVWAEGYFWGRAVHRAFDHFWNNTEVQGQGLQDHFADLWQTLARRYADSPAFMGFDFLNEPFPGSPGGKTFRKLVAKLVRVVAVSPSVKRIQFLKTVLNKKTRGYALDVLTPEVLYKVTQGGAAEKIHKKFYAEKYSPFLAKMTAAVREVTKKGLIFVEHSYFSNLAVPFTAELPENEEVCYSPHGYDFMVDTPAYAFANNERVGAIFHESRRAQERLNVPVLVGEWGGGGEGESFFPHIEYLMNLYDSYNWSNAYFTYTKGFFDRPIIRVISRPYPVAVNGDIKGYGYDSDACRFTLEFSVDANADPSVSSEIYLPCAPATVEVKGGLQYKTEAIAEDAGFRLLLNGGAGDCSVIVTLAPANG